jgi:hypothetical protein
MLLRPALMLLALAASGLARGEAPDPPERIAQLSYVEGELTYQAADEVASSALPDRPLAPGDRLATASDGRAELTLGTAAIRLDERSALEIIDLDADLVRVELAAGTASLYLRELLDGETIEIVTPNATLAFLAPGEYRVDVPDDGVTDLAVRAGAVDVMTAGGPIRVADGQRVRLEGSQALASLVTPRPADAFDDWVLEREVQVADAEPPPGAPTEEAYAEETLDDYGEWTDDPGYGRVWMPSYAYGGYNPYGYGYWHQVGFSYTWIDPMPWSAYTFHHGRWAYLDHHNRWCWVPERRRHRDRVAQDTRPYRQPRDDGARPVVNPRDRRSDDLARRGNDDRQPVATTSRGLPRPFDANIPSLFRSDINSAKNNPRPSTVARSFFGRGQGSKSASSSGSAPAAQGNSSGGNTTRSSSPARSSSTSRSNSSSKSPMSTVIKRAYGGTPQPP